MKAEKGLNSNDLIILFEYILSLYIYNCMKRLTFIIIFLNTNFFIINTH